jgi:hypothetical protein
MARYFANVARISPDEVPGAIGVLSDPSKPGDVIGIAYAADHLGGWRGDWSRAGSEPGTGRVDPEYLGSREATWRLVVGKAEVFSVDRVFEPSSLAKRRLQSRIPIVPDPICALRRFDLHEIPTSLNEMNIDTFQWMIAV